MPSFVYPAPARPSLSLTAPASRAHPAATQRDGHAGAGTLAGSTQAGFGLDAPVPHVGCDRTSPSDYSSPNFFATQGPESTPLPASSFNTPYSSSISLANGEPGKPWSCSLRFADLLHRIGDLGHR